MDRRLVGIICLTIVVPIVADILILWNPIPPVKMAIGEVPQVPLWWLLAYFGLFLLTIIVYPVLFFIAIFLLAKGLDAKSSQVMISIAIASALASVVAPFIRSVFEFGTLVPQDPTSPLSEFFWRFLPQTMVNSFVYEFLLILGAVALPHLLTKTNEVP